MEAFNYTITDNSVIALLGTIAFLLVAVAIVWKREARRQRWYRSLQYGDRVQFLHGQRLLMGEITQVHAHGVTVKARENGREYNVHFEQLSPL